LYNSIAGHTVESFRIIGGIGWTCAAQLMVHTEQRQRTIAGYTVEAVIVRSRRWAIFDTRVAELVGVIGVVVLSI